MDDMLSQISNILENPDALDKIKSIAAELGGGMSGGGGTSSSGPSEGGDSSAAFSEASGLLSGLNINFDGSRAIALLEAMRPFMRESRVPKVNTAIKAVQMMGVLSKLK